MPAIRNAQGVVVQYSRNLRGIRDYVRTHLVDTVHITTCENGTGVLSIAFDNGDTYTTNFASVVILKGFVKRWRSVYGSRLVIDGLSYGRLDKTGFGLD